jgi:adenylate cyclase
VQIALVFIVFMLFLSNATGLIEITLKHGGHISVSSYLFVHDSVHGLSVRDVFVSPEFIVLLLTGITLSILLPLLNPIPASILTLVVTLPPVYLDYSNPDINPLLPMEYSLLTILMLYVFNVLVIYFIETHVKQRLINTFGQYIPPHLVNEVISQPETISMEGESRTLTLFFCDLQNFTGVSEQLNPKQLTLLLNEYFNVMTEILFKHGATIDKYIGDSIMAFWGAPIVQEDPETKSVLAAIEMDTAIHKLSDEFKKKGWPGPTMGIGINTGRVNVGNMGSKYRITYTAVGDAVNLAARLEKLTRKYQVPIIISDFTKNGLKGILCREIDTVQVRGKLNKTRIFQPLCTEDDASEALKNKLKMHDVALQHYYSNEWDQAKSLFKELHNMYKEDLYYRAMLDILDKEQKHIVISESQEDLSETQ